MANSNLHSVVQDQCRELIKQNPKITAQEIVETLGCSISSARRYLNEAKAKEAPKPKKQSYSAQIYMDVKAASEDEAEELAKKKLQKLLKAGTIKIHIIEE